MSIRPHSVSHIDLRTGVVAGLEWYPYFRVNSCDVLLLSKDVIADDSNRYWEHVAVAFHTNDGMLAFDVSPNDGIFRLRLATELVNDGWRSVGVSPWHSRPKDSYITRLYNLATSLINCCAMRYDSIGRTIQVMKLFDDANDSITTVVMDEQLTERTIDYERIRGCIDIAVGSTYLEYPNIVANVQP